MLRDDRYRPHRLTIDYIRHTIEDAIKDAETTYNYSKLETAKADRRILDLGWSSYRDAHTNFIANNNDDTMINLIGTWARNTKIIRDMDDKYGSRE